MCSVNSSLARSPPTRSPDSPPVSSTVAAPASPVAARAAHAPVLPIRQPRSRWWGRDRRWRSCRDKVTVTTTEHDFVDMTVKPTASKPAKTAIAAAAATAILLGTRTTSTTAISHVMASTGNAATIVTT